MSVSDEHSPSIEEVKDLTNEQQHMKRETSDRIERYYEQKKKSVPDGDSRSKKSLDKIKEVNDIWRGDQYLQ